MKLSDQLWLSFHNLMLHKIRSVLTSLGIIFGVGSVIAMLSISEGAKREALAQTASGAWQAVIGTHALLSDAVRYQKLGLVITDEQHLMN